MGPEGLQLVKYIEAIGCPTGLLHQGTPHGVPFLFFVVVTGSQAAGVLEC